MPKHGQVRAHSLRKQTEIAGTQPGHGSCCRAPAPAFPSVSGDTDVEQQTAAALRNQKSPPWYIWKLFFFIGLSGLAEKPGIGNGFLLLA